MKVLEISQVGVHKYVKTVQVIRVFLSKHKQNKNLWKAVEYAASLCERCQELLTELCNDTVNLPR